MTRIIFAPSDSENCIIENLKKKNTTNPYLLCFWKWNYSLVFDNESELFSVHKMHI